MYRERRGLNQKELARIAGVSQSIVSQLESGAKPFRQGMLDLLCKALNVDYQHLFCPTIDELEKMAESKRKADPDEYQPDKYRRINRKLIKLNNS